MESSAGPFVCRVLVVDDSPDDARFVRDALDEAQAGYPGAPRFQHAWVDRLASAIQILGERDFDVVLLDLILPDTDAKLEGLARIRERAPATPIVVLTGLDDVHLAMDAVNQGAQDFLVKGEVTTSALERALLGARAREHLERVRCEELAERARREAAQMTAGIIAHEVRSPVGAALGMIELIHDDPAVCEGLRADLDVIDSELKRANEILSQYEAVPRRL